MNLLPYTNKEAIAMMFNDVHGTSVYPYDFEVTKRRVESSGAITATLTFRKPHDPIYPHRYTGVATVTLDRLDLTEVFGNRLAMDMYYPVTTHDVLTRIMGGKGYVFDLDEFPNERLGEERVTIRPREDSLRWRGELHLELQDPVNTLDIIRLAPHTTLDPMYHPQDGRTVHQLAPNPHLVNI